ncbi:MAG: ATP-binding cassette domain-containing protein [Lachnospiraceae bacterium]|jgi:oligopeptide transport system ATP-binding protein|nr:ATP-binding cassette domain-containing protein [Lachnospiraceae bacterium]
MEDKKVLLSIKDLEVKFRVRGKKLTAIRGVSLDIYENESIAIVGESGSGKSVFTKTFAGMLDSNGYIDNGSIIFNDEDLADTIVRKTSVSKKMIDYTFEKLNAYSQLELGAEIYKEIEALKAEHVKKASISVEQKEQSDKEIAELGIKKTEVFNLKQTLDPKTERAKIKELSQSIKQMEKEIKKLLKDRAAMEVSAKKRLESDTAYINQYNSDMAALKAKYDAAIKGSIRQETKERNEILAKEVYLSIGRYSFHKRVQMLFKFLAAFKAAMKIGTDLSDDIHRNTVFDKVAFRVKYLDETSDKLHGICVLNLANVKYAKDWYQIRGKKIATVFQDPMTSLNPIITIGKQITSIIMKHQDVTEVEARAKALDLMKKVGIPNAEARFDDYPFQYSGGMRQRIVIAIALSCQPKILICDEPTTALDVTIQAQILKLLKDLQKEFNYTIVFITHDLGVVANIADRVAVVYAGQIIELASVDEIFYDPRHPYTWALLSSMPQLAEKNTKLYSITGTPPSLYNKVVGDAFAPRNPYCMKIDTLKEPPMFQVSDTHFAKTWLLDPRSPRVEKPEAIQNIHEKLLKAFNI